MSWWKNISEPLIELFYPNLCFACQKKHAPKDSSICISCEYHITPTGYHLLDENPVLERFWGRVELQHAATCFAFNKGGLLQKLIHQLKYENQPQVGIELGKIHGAMLKETPIYQSVDYIVPVPLHPKKQHQRGYNQATMFAEGLSQTMNIPCLETCLVRTDYTDSQTKKSRLDRFANVQNAFEVKEQDQIKGKHLLLVDDVITTGATLEACALQLLAVDNVQISLAAIALASQ